VHVEARIVRLPLAETLVIAREEANYADVVHVALTHDGVTGYGEAAPIDRYDESAESAIRFVDDHGALVGDDPFALEDIGERLGSIRGEQAAKAALDAALHDLQGKLLGIPAFRLLGLPRTGPPTSWTVWLGDPDDMAQRAEKAAGTYRRLKLKLGGGDGLDVERVRAVRGVTELPLMVDVNEWWSLDEALDALPQLAEIGVEYCEQPLRAGDGGGRDLKDRSPIPIYVDEDCHTLADVATCAEIAHGINIKLGKSGGIREAIRMTHAARALRMGVMLGCMLESGLGIAAGCCVAPLCDHIDLDGNLLLREDPWPGVELVDGVQVPSLAPGLGVSARA
jgi:L-alanine-DL-glutamate epimerase-like enolase superfamily enzyme